MRHFAPAAAPLRGTISVPGDKSLSHRAVLFAALAEGTSRLEGVLSSEDVEATIRVVTALGARVDLAPGADGTLAGTVTGWGSAGPTSPVAPLDCGNSGTTARLILGVLAGWPVTATLVGDASLSRRPMRRITEPLAAMGAHFETSEGGTLPVVVRGTASLAPLQYDSPVASAQVKTALLLAGLRARGGVRVTEPALSRDHTERLLPAFGIAMKVDADSRTVSLCGPQVPVASTVRVPGDPSSAAFLVAAALLVPGSAVVIPGVSLNPTRVAFLDVLDRMGAALEVIADATEGAEPVGTISCRYGDRLEATAVKRDEVPGLIDEVPVLALVAATAHGTTVFDGVEELRVKESDRLAAVAAGLSALGVVVREQTDRLEVDGPTRFGAAALTSLGDHRLAMCWALAGVAGTGTDVDGFEAVKVSYPGFEDALAALGA